MEKHVSKLIVIGLICIASALLGSLCTELFAVNSRLPNNKRFPNPTGFHATFSVDGTLDLTNNFFQDLGTNGRDCNTCHLPEQGWTITPEGVQQRFAQTGGMDPIFRTNDGSNSPLADVSTVAARRNAYSMLLTKGVIRIPIGVPSDADFELIYVDDPYGYASAQELSLFRRPLPATNLKFLSTIMWDGRETVPGDLQQGLKNQARDATLGHAQATKSPTPSQLQSIVDFELANFTTQVYDKSAKELTARGAEGGPVNLSNQLFYVGINDNLGDSQTQDPFNPIVFTIYDDWNNLPGGGTQAARAAVARGQSFFNSRTFTITGVAGLNDNPAFGNSIEGTCSTCHNAPNVGDHSVVLPLNIGIADAERRTLDMPLYIFQKKGSTETIQVTDPGRALISKKFKDIGKFKGPILRGLAARAPYFHNGSAKDLDAVIEFFDDRFNAGITPQEKADLVAFLLSL